MEESALVPQQVKQRCPYQRLIFSEQLQVWTTGHVQSFCLFLFESNMCSLTCKTTSYHKRYIVRKCFCIKYKGYKMSIRLVVSFQAHLLIQSEGTILGPDSGSRFIKVWVDLWVRLSLSIFITFLLKLLKCTIVFGMKYTCISGYWDASGLSGTAPPQDPWHQTSERP